MTDAAPAPSLVPGPPPAAEPSPFLASLPEDVRGNEHIIRAGSLEALARGYVQAQTIAKSDPLRTVVLPGADDTDGKQQRAILTRLGLPEKVEDYSFTAPEGAGEAMALDKPLAKEFVTKAFEAGILPKQAEALYGWFAQRSNEAAKAQTDAAAAATASNLATLKGEWGENFPARVAAADYAVQELGGDELFDALTAAGLNTSPVVLRALSKIGLAMASKPLPTEAVGTSRFGDARSKEELHLAARDMMRKAHNAKSQSEAAEWSAKAQELYARAS